MTDGQADGGSRFATLPTPEFLAKLAKLAKFLPAPEHPEAVSPFRTERAPEE